MTEVRTVILVVLDAQIDKEAKDAVVTAIGTVKGVKSVKTEEIEL